ncbi:hypothetical protein [Shewanella acanthi]|uniref:hypothetical protein n=1 Tax=Shewanella acanthi TaxID=2864212 RepID=UPI001C65A894|nr:hypothetical protein [Shewanella acanthi]QYJ77913.1 hypothetical protein K0H61_12380 [Shewanella acanthi]
MTNQELVEKLDKYCSHHYRFRDLFHCGETWLYSQCDNLPSQPQSWTAYSQIATEILDPLTEQFGEIHLSFGFCGKQLRNLILKKDRPRIAPNLDQHAAYELNQSGGLICPRGGAAIDLKVINTSSQILAIWAASNLPFDRLYYYGSDRPLHISIGPQNNRQIIWLKNFGNRLIPRQITLENLTNLANNG